MFSVLSVEPLPAKPSRYVIIAQLRLTSTQVFAEAISRLGTVCAVAESAWILASTYTLATIHNLLVQSLRPADRLFIVDIARDKASWTSYGPSEEARIRQMWAI
ncbi:MAG: hypothetical protein ACJ8IR_03800 [Alphaproteobacteria bacterium]